MKAYSEDLRKKVVEALERGVPKTEAARLFGVSLSSVKRYARIARQGGSLVLLSLPVSTRAHPCTDRLRAASPQG
jgi:transposase